MKQFIILLIILLFSIPTFAEMSENISLSDGWYITYEKTWTDDPAKFHFANISAYVADKITITIYIYDSHGKELSVIQRTLGNIVKPGYESTFTLAVPREMSTMRAEVYCDWR